MISEIVHKMMARAPADRYQHAREITHDLKKVGRLIKDDPGAAGAVKLKEITVPTPTATMPTAPRVVVRWSEGFFKWSLTQHAIALGIAILVLGSASAAVGWWLRPTDPLQAAAIQENPTSREGSAQKQFARANQLRSDEDAWKAVLDYFPEDRVYTVQAKERLAVLYLRTLRLKEASKLFSELEGMGRENPKEHAARHRRRGDRRHPAKGLQKVAGTNLRPGRPLTAPRPDQRRLVANAATRRQHQRPRTGPAREQAAAGSLRGRAVGPAHRRDSARRAASVSWWVLRLALRPVSRVDR